MLGGGINDSEESFIPPLDADPAITLEISRRKSDLFTSSEEDNSGFSRNEKRRLVPPVDAMTSELQKAQARSRKNKRTKPENEIKNEKRRKSHPSTRPRA